MTDPPSNRRDTLRVGVVGVGSMGENHARIYAALPDVDLVGVADADPDRAADVAAEYGTDAVDRATLLDRADAVSVAVPTQFHAEVTRECIDAGVHALVEKPFVADPETGAALVDAAREHGVALQAGHVERFNPAVEALFDLLDGESIAVEAHRLGPPLDRDVGDDVMLDLMIHDVDVVCALADAPVASVSASRAADGGYATAQLTFENGLVASLTASRVTQRKVRTLDVTAPDRLLQLDYTDQSLRVHRHSRPEYETADGEVRHRHESVTERPLIASDEPLKRELASFADAVESGEKPRVSGADALRAVELVKRIQADARESAAPARSCDREPEVIE